MLATVKQEALCVALMRAGKLEKGNPANSNLSLEKMQGMYRNLKPETKLAVRVHFIDHLILSAPRSMV